jgi:hypothetical protein
MVFPHGVAPKATFAALEAKGFLGTANSINVPLDVPFPADPLFLLRPYSTSYGNLLSLSRYSVEATLSPLDIAIQFFLGNPLLLYAHQAFFHDGSRAFNATADFMNQMEPGTKWVSLGDLSLHLYQLRRREDGNIDVRMLSREMILSLSSQSGVHYFVTFKTASSAPISRVEVDGSPVAYQRTADGISFESGSSRKDTQKIVVVYASDSGGTQPEIRRVGFKTNVLRRISDFRDMHISRYAWGRAMIDSYYNHDGELLEKQFEERWYLSAALAAIGLAVVGFLIRQHRRRILKPSRVG